MQCVCGLVYRYMVCLLIRTCIHASSILICVSVLLPDGCRGVVHSSVELFEAGGDCNDREIKVVGEVRDRDCVLEIPLKLIMTLTKAQGTPLAVELQAQLDAEFKFLDDHDTWLAIFLLDEHSKAEESFYFPYLATLPSTYLTNPLYYNSEELSLLRGSMCLRHVKRHHDELIYEYAQLQTLLPAFTDKHSFERFVWARLSVLSRQFSMDYGCDGRDKEASLVPMLEMVNHDSAQRNVLWDFDTGSQSAKLVADGPLSATSTRDPHLYVSYGQKSNARLLLYYGFVMKNNGRHLHVCGCAVCDVAHVCVLIMFLSAVLSCIM